MGRWNKNKYGLRICTVILLVLLIFSFIAIMMGKSPLITYASAGDAQPADTGTPVATLTDTNTPGSTPPPPPPTNTPTPVIIPTPSAIIIYPSPTVTVTPTPVPQPSPTTVSNKTPTPMPTASGGGFIPPPDTPTPTSGPGTLTPTPDPTVSPTPGPSTATPLATSTTVPGITDTTQMQHGSGLPANLFKVSAAIGGALLLLAGVVGILMRKRQTRKNIQLVQNSFVPAMAGQSMPPSWTNRTEIDATFRAPLPMPGPLSPAITNNHQQYLAEMVTTSTPTYQQSTAPQPLHTQSEPPQKAPTASGSRLLSQARGTQHNAKVTKDLAQSDASRLHIDDLDTSSASLEAARTNAPTPQNILADPFIVAMMRQAQAGVFVLPGKSTS